MSRRAGPRSSSDVHELMVRNAALRASNVGNPGVMELLLPLRGGKGEAPVPRYDELPPAVAFSPCRLDPEVEAVVRRRRLAVAGGLGAEDREQAAIVAMFDDELLEGRSDALAIMVANEVRVPLPRVAKALGVRLLKLGLLPGASDLLLMWPTAADPRFGVMEVKRPAGGRYFGRTKGRDVVKTARAGSLEPEQRAFLRQMEAWRVPRGVVHGPAEAAALAVAWAVPHARGWEGVGGR